MNVLKRIVPLLVLASVVMLYFVFDLGRFLSFDALAEHRVMLLAWVESHRMLAPLVYMALYIVVVAFSLPGGLLMTITGGFLFGAMAGAIYAVVGATVGATALFLIAKTSLGDYLLSKAGDMVQNMQKGFAEDALSYMFVLRLVPIFPFFIVNLVPAFLGVSWRIYVMATFFGIMPATFVYALAGSGLGSVLDQGLGVSFAGVLTPEILAAFVGLAVLAMIPPMYKRLGKKDLAAGENK